MLGHTGLDRHTFVNGFTPVQLALGQQSNIPVSNERTQPTQLSSEEHMRQTLQKRASAQTDCIKADIDVKLRRSLLKQFRGLEADLSAGERGLYWRESNNKFHTMRWRGLFNEIQIRDKLHVTGLLMAQS